jgi:hypothetical protein
MNIHLNPVFGDLVPSKSVREEREGEEKRQRKEGG